MHGATVKIKTGNLNEFTVLIFADVGNNHEGHVTVVTYITYRVLCTRLLHLRQSAEPVFRLCTASFCHPV
jgi:hypothetical protein